jgi:ketosteroid isomerase-like protein
MKIFLFGAILFLGHASLSLAREVRSKAGLLAVEETAFAQEALEKGMRSAFLDVLSPDAIVFDPGPQNGRKNWEGKPESTNILQWHPVLAAIATEGDLGYTTGPWALRKRLDSEPVEHGQFVTIWRRENDRWKLVFDIDSKNSRPNDPRPDLQLVKNRAPNQSPVEAQLVMLEHDRQYAADRMRQLPACADDNVRLYLPQKFPFTSKEEAIAALRADATPIKFGEPKANISRGGDLGYLWGEYTAGSAREPTGYYLRIWRKDRAGEWKLVLDLLHPR